MSSAVTALFRNDVSRPPAKLRNGAPAACGRGRSGKDALARRRRDALRAAEHFVEALRRRSKAAFFMKTLILQRICSSFASGRLTAERMLRKEALEDEDEEKQSIEGTLRGMTEEERPYLESFVEELSRPEAHDPKVAAVRYFLSEHRTDGKNWLEHGCIIFSQYYDTVRTLALELGSVLPGEPVAVYAGAGKSGIHLDGDFASVEREEI